VDFCVFCLDPGKLINHFVPPFIHALISYVHLGIQDPEEAETFLGQILDRDINNFLVAHRTILQVEFVIGKHET
jgi:hypothetical protein